MTQPRGFPSWQALYEEDTIEKLPWYWPKLDPDLDAALSRHGLTAGRILDQGTGPGTQAIALAQRGYAVTASDVSASAIAYASRQAEALGASVDFVLDDVLAPRMAGPFDAVFDRGCFHVLAPEQRAGYAQTMHRLIVPSGWLFLKTFSHLQPGDQGPHRFEPGVIRAIFGAAGLFEVVEVLDTAFQGQLDPWPKALFASLRRLGD